MRRTFTILALCALGLPLVACSTDSAIQTGSGDCAASTSGSASASVTATGDFGSQPTIDFKTPLSPAATQVSVLIKGAGETVRAGQAVVMDYTMFNAATGDQIDGSRYAGAAAAVPLTLDETSLLPGFFAALVCQRIGSRVAAVIPPADAWGDVGNQALGVGGKESILLVADLLEIDSLPVPADWTKDVPSIEWAGDMPTVTIPDVDAPSDLRLIVLRKGDGEVVPAGASVTVDYLGVNWGTGEVFDESYSSAPRGFSVSGVVEGFAAAIVGQRVGSQVLVSIPPVYGYGEAGDGNTSPLAGQTLVFLIDIVSVDKAVSG